jgi:hypothetical protein
VAAAVHGFAGQLVCWDWVLNTASVNKKHAVLQVAEASLRCNDLAELNQKLAAQLEQQQGQLQQVCANAQPIGSADISAFGITAFGITGKHCRVV